MDATSLSKSILQSGYIKNFILLFPLFLLGGLIAFLLNRAESLREGAGLPHLANTATNGNRSPGYVPLGTADDDNREEEWEGVEGEEGQADADVDELLAEAGGAENGGFEDGDEVVGNLDDREDEAARPDAGRPLPPRANKVVGKKKLKSLELRDRRRAYNEFLQSQAAERREREKALEEEEKERLFEEKQRRALAEINIEKRKMREKQERKEREEKEARYIAALRKAINELKSGKISLRTLGHRVGRDENWVRKILVEDKTVSVTGLKEVKGGGKVYSIVTQSGWLVRIGKEEIAGLAGWVEEKEKVDWEELGVELEGRLKKM